MNGPYPEFPSARAKCGTRCPTQYHYNRIWSVLSEFSSWAVTSGRGLSAIITTRALLVLVRARVAEIEFNRLIARASGYGAVRVDELQKLPWL